jgi:hypothetical protein
LNLWVIQSNLACGNGGVQVRVVIVESNPLWFSSCVAVVLEMEEKKQVKKRKKLLVQALWAAKSGKNPLDAQLKTSARRPTPEKSSFPLNVGHITARSLCASKRAAQLPSCQELPSCWYFFFVVWFWVFNGFYMWFGLFVWFGFYFLFLFSCFFFYFLFLYFFNLNILNLKIFKFEDFLI